jgi:hypothetical protein
VRQHELAIVRGRQRAHPGIEELDGLGPGGDLPVEVRRGDAGEARHQRMPCGGLRPHEALGVEELARGASLDEIGGEREGRAREADQRHAVRQRLAHEAYRLEDEPHR